MKEQNDKMTSAQYLGRAKSTLWHYINQCLRKDSRIPIGNEHKKEIYRIVDDIYCSVMETVHSNFERMR